MKSGHEVSGMIKESRKIESFFPKIQHCLEFSGFFSGNRNWNDFGFLFRRYALYVLRTFFIVQSSLLFITNWKSWDMELRTVWLEEFSCVMNSFIYASNFYSRKHADTAMHLVQPKFFYDDEIENNDQITVLTGEAAKIVDFEDARTYNLLLSAEYFFNLFMSVYILKPILRIILFRYGVKQLDGTALPVMCFNPFVRPLTPDITEVSHVLVLSLVQFVYLYDITMTSHATHEGLLFSIGNVVTDMKVLRSELAEMKHSVEQQTEQFLNSACRIELKIEGHAGDNDSWHHIQKMMRRICCHHQAVFRKAKEASETFTFPILSLNGFYCIYVCLGMYCMVEGEFTAMITHCIANLMVIFTCFIFCENGQRIETEGEKLQSALYDCCVGYRGVPLWYQKCILMLIMRHKRPPSLGPFRMFSLNRNNFKVVAQGALTYFNILNNLAE